VVKVGSLDGPSGTNIVQSKEEPHKALTKKEKLQIKRDAFMDKLRLSHSSSSKNQKRRLKKKQKEQVGGGLEAIQAALSALDDDDGVPKQTVQVADKLIHPKVKPKLGQIGEGKGAPLTKNQRKQALKMERLRAPMILANPEFASHPFQTIRTHAQNTLLKHEHPV